MARNAQLQGLDLPLRPPRMPVPWQCAQPFKASAKVSERVQSKSILPAARPAFPAPARRLKSLDSS